MIAFLLENTVFLLIGLQAWWIVEGAAESDLGAGRIVALCAATLAACIVLRLLWVFPARYLIVRPGAERDGGERPPWTYTFILGWAGMRGVVTLAAAFVIPEETEYHEVLLLIAFTVVAGTLFIQGLTLPVDRPPVEVPGPDPAEDALARATLLQQASKAALHELDNQEYDDRHGVVDLIKQRLELRNFAAWERLATAEGQESPSDLYNRIRTAMIQAERDRVLEIRDAGSVASEVVEDVLAMLDIEESMLDVAAEDRRDVRNALLRAAYRRLVRGPREATRRSRPRSTRRARPASTSASTGSRCGSAWLRRRRLLRLLAAAARDRALPRDRAPGHRVRRAGRGLALVLRAPHDRLTARDQAQRTADGSRKVVNPVMPPGPKLSSDSPWLRNAPISSSQVLKARAGWPLAAVGSSRQRRPSAIGTSARNAATAARPRYHSA